ncbi:MAG: DNA translocase FtsK 4TM domain-containing protein [Planctomycetota bacterium]|nr:DNA translocase FtsK 4TM domain-containing protein [Planctomycetota bacterium]MDA1114010.1 DNA translocase FtsK 4TM domain-containing protein [Planctomycetota bacterium]
MATSRKKKTTRKTASEKKTTQKRAPKRNQAGTQVGFMGAGVGVVLGWAATIFLTVASALRWFGSVCLAALQGKRGRQPFGMVLAAASIYVLVALLSYEQGSGNLCGRLGYNLADWLLVFLGMGAFVMPAFGAFWGIARLLRESSSGYAEFKLVGIVLLSFTGSLIAQASGDVVGTNTFPSGQGGWIGSTVYPSLSEALGPFGIGVVLTLLACLSSFMATEWAFVPLVRDLLKRGAGSLKQQDLPWGSKERKAILEEAEENRARAASGMRRFWNMLRGEMQPFEIEQEKAAAAAAEAEEVVVVDEVAPPMKLKIGGKNVSDDAEGEPLGGEQSAAEKPQPKPAPSEVKPVTALNPDGEFALPGISKTPEMRSAELDADEGLELARRKKAQRKPTLASMPSSNLLIKSENSNHEDQRGEINELGRKLQVAFDAFGLDGKVVGAERGPTLTMFEVQLAAGVSVKKLKSQREDLGIALGTHSVRIVFPLAGRSTVGIEVPNLKRDSVRLKDVFDGQKLDVLTNKLPMVLGCDTLGKKAVEDLAKMPHMLIAGTTGSGKSVCINSILVTMLLTRTPDQVRFVMIDPKQVELQVFADIPHLLCPVVTDMKRAPFVLDWSVRQMEDRLHMFKMVGVRSINDYNQIGVTGLQKILGDAYDAEEYPANIPYYVIVIDELADLMMTAKKEVETAIARIAAKARAAGIHLIVATQRPSTDVVTGLIKANLPVRVSFRVNTGIDSRVVLDEGGAECLLGNGDFLYRPPGSAVLVRGQGAFVSTKEVNDVCDHLRRHGKPEFLEDLIQMKGPAAGSSGEVDDPMYDEAVRVILQSGRGSASLIQRALSVGYTRASRLIDIMTEQGVLGPFVGSKAREVLMTVEEWEERNQQPQ